MASVQQVINYLNDNNVKLYVNDKNYGPIHSPYHGLQSCKGDLVFLIAADLQEPPELILKCLEAIDLGFDAAVGIKKQSKESTIMWGLRGIYYLILKNFGLIDDTKRFSGFGLYKRDLIDKFSQANVDEPSIRLLLPKTTDNIKYILYTHKERISGNSTYNIFSYSKEALKTIIRNSNKVSTFSAKLALTMTIFSFSCIPLSLFIKLYLWNSMAPGIATIVILLFFTNSLIMLFISLVLERQNVILNRLKPRFIKVKQKSIF